MILGRAYWLSGDEKYSAVFAQHLDSWMDRIPPKLGINWASSLEVPSAPFPGCGPFIFFSIPQS